MWWWCCLLKHHRVSFAGVWWGWWMISCSLRPIWVKPRSSWRTSSRDTYDTRVIPHARSFFYVSVCVSGRCWPAFPITAARSTRRRWRWISPCVRSGWIRAWASSRPAVCSRGAACCWTLARWTSTRTIHGDGQAAISAALSGCKSGSSVYLICACSHEMITDTCFIHIPHSHKQIDLSWRVAGEWRGISVIVLLGSRRCER